MAFEGARKGKWQNGGSSQEEGHHLKDWAEQSSTWVWTRRMTEKMLGETNQARSRLLLSPPACADRKRMRPEENYRVSFTGAGWGRSGASLSGGDGLQTEHCYTRVWEHAA